MLAGCFGNDDSEEKNLIDLVVHYDATNGTIQQSFIGGSQISFTGVTFSFDFARTTSDYGLETFTLDPGDGRPVISIDASESANIDVEYQIHGMYTVILAATDINDNTANQTVTLRVEHTIVWSETNSADPDTMEINTTPGNEGSNPRQVVLESVVENPRRYFCSRKSGYCNMGTHRPRFKQQRYQYSNKFQMVNQVRGTLTSISLIWASMI